MLALSDNFLSPRSVGLCNRSTATTRESQERPLVSPKPLAPSDPRLVKQRSQTIHPTRTQLLCKVDGKIRLIFGGAAVLQRLKKLTRFLFHYCCTPTADNTKIYSSITVATLRRCAEDSIAGRPSFFVQGRQLLLLFLQMS